MFISLSLFFRIILDYRTGMNWYWFLSEPLETEAQGPGSAPMMTATSKTLQSHHHEFSGINDGESETSPSTATLG